MTTHSIKEYDIKLFGAIEISGNGQPLTDFRSRKALTILAYLISVERPIAREYLAGLAWPDASTQQALGLLRRSLHDLSRKLPGCLVADRRTVTFSSVASTTVDIRMFRRLATHDDPAAWAQAATFYRAPFLEGMYLDDAPELESWLLREQEHWQQEIASLLERLIDHHSAAGTYDDALHYAQQLLSIVPWREEAHRHLMILLARTGQISAALAQYSTCRRILWEESAVEPAQDTQALYGRLQSVSRQQSRQLPQSATSFIGRQDEIAHLTRWLATSNVRFITIVGVGGIGKTRLALEIAHTVVTDKKRMFLHGVIFVRLAGVDTSAQMVMTIMQSLGLMLKGHDDPDTQILRYLRDQELLIVLDNFEQLIDEQSLAFVIQALEAAPEVKFLVTARTQLGLHCEQLYWLQGLDMPTDATSLTAVTAPEYSAIQLWAETVRRRQPGYVPTTAELSALYTIVRQVQGLPLALELAAARRSTRSTEAIAEELATSLDVLSTHAPDIPPRQRSMRAIFQTALLLLTPPEQKIFQRLAVFRGGFTAELAQAVADADTTLLHALLDKALISRGDNGRFILHELIRQFSVEQLAAKEQLNAAQQRLGETLLTYIEEIEPDRCHSGTRPGLTVIQAEYENVQAALAWCFREGDGALGLALVAALRDFWQLTNSWQEGRKWQEKALDFPMSDETLVERARVLNEWGALLGLMGEISLAQSAHEESLRIFESLSDEREQAWTRYHLGCPEYQGGDDAICNELLLSALATFRQLSEALGIAYTLQRLTVQMLDGTEDLIQAKRFATESLTIARELDLRSNIAGTLILLGEIAIRQDDLAGAEAYLIESTSLSAPSSGLRSWALGKLGRVFLKKGRSREAKAAFQEVLRIRQELGSVIGVAWMLEALGEVAVTEQANRQAVEMFGAAATLRARHGQPLLAVDKRTFEDLLIKTRATLGEACFSTSWKTGEQMAHDQTNFVALFGLASEEVPVADHHETY